MQKPHLLKSLLLSILAFGLLVFLYYEDWLNAAILFGIIILSMVPTLFARHFSLAVAAAFDIATILFIVASIALGELAGFYDRFWWWDELLHLISGLLLGMLGLSLIWVLNYNDRIELELSPGFMCLFAFTFALSAGAIWEIFEYAMDLFFKLNMQKSGLDDTMSDLMVDALGALIVSLLAKAYLTRGRRSILSNWMEQFLALNKKTFIRRKLKWRKLRLKKH